MSEKKCRFPKALNVPQKNDRDPDQILCKNLERDPDHILSVKKRSRSRTDPPSVPFTEVTWILNWLH